MVDHIHTVDDGRGPRRVFVDGREIASPIYADTKRGIVDAYAQPVRLDKHRKRILTRRYRGAVEVVTIDG